MLTTKTRTGLTEKNVLSREKYVNIFALLDLALHKPMRQAHLEEKLVLSSKKYGKESYFTGTYSVLLPFYTKVDTFWGLAFPENKFQSKHGLRRALTRLKKLDLIESYKPKHQKRCYSSLRLTDKGEILWTKFLIQKHVDGIDDRELLDKINIYVWDRIGDLRREGKQGGLSVIEYIRLKKDIEKK